VCLWNWNKKTLKSIETCKIIFANSKSLLLCRSLFLCDSSKPWFENSQVEPRVILKLEYQYINWKLSICFLKLFYHAFLVSLVLHSDGSMLYCYRGQDGSIKRSRAQVSCSSVENFMPRSSVYGSDSKNTKAPFYIWIFSNFSFYVCGYATKVAANLPWKSQAWFNKLFGGSEVPLSSSTNFSTTE